MAIDYVKQDLEKIQAKLVSNLTQLKALALAPDLMGGRETVVEDLVAVQTKLLAVNELLVDHANAPLVRK